VLVSRALLGICKDFLGKNDLPERSIRVARSDVGVGAFDGLTECGPETFQHHRVGEPRANHKAYSSSLSIQYDRMTCICAEPLLHDPSAFPRTLLSSGLSFLLPLQMRTNDHLRFDNIFRS
jgi:hypothetical protein